MEDMHHIIPQNALMNKLLLFEDGINFNRIDKVKRSLKNSKVSKSRSINHEMK